MGWAITDDRFGQALEAAIKAGLKIDFTVQRLREPEHPNTATSLSNLGWLLAATGRVTEAERCVRRALSVLESALGPEHPNARAAADLLENIRSVEK